MQTTYIDYLGVQVTFATNGTAFADYPNKTKIVTNVNNQVNDNTTTRQLLSDKSRYRVYYQKNSLAQLFTDIEAVM